MIGKNYGPSESNTGWAVYFSERENLIYVAYLSRWNIGKRRLRGRVTSRVGAGAFSGTLLSGESSPGSWPV
ncbi:MAG TPA: hypothetical protein VGI34_11015, partial [Candidatus Acidoferrales bacterium]